MQAAFGAKCNGEAPFPLLDRGQRSRRRRCVRSSPLRKECPRVRLEAGLTLDAGLARCVVSCLRRSAAADAEVRQGQEADRAVGRRVDDGRVARAGAVWQATVKG